MTTQEIYHLANSYGFDCKVLDNGNIHLASAFGMDEWVVIKLPVPNGAKKYKLMHKPIGKTKFHTQRKFYDLPFLFKSIDEHDSYRLNGSRYSSVDRMFAKIR